VKGKLAAASDDIARALAGTAEVKREGDSVWIEGVPVLAWGGMPVAEMTPRIDGNCTYIGATAAALAVTEHPYGYSDMLVYTGLAFRVRWGRRADGAGWIMAGPVGEFPEEQKALARATGWQTLWRYSYLEGQNATPHVPEIVASIDACRPMIAYPGNLDMGVIYGYEDDGQTLLVRDYYKGDGLHRISPDDVRMHVLLEEHADGMSPRQALIEGLRIGLRNWSRGAVPAEQLQVWPPNGEEIYWHGDSAYEKWIGDLGRTDDLADGERDALYRASTWVYHRLYDSHLWGGRCIAHNSGLLGEAARPHLERVAEIYEKARLLIIKPMRVDKEAFFALEPGKSIDDWTPEVRKREQEILREVWKLDAEAIAEIEKALSGIPEGLTPAVCEVIILAEEEARRLKHNFIGTEHLLLGIVRVDGFARAILNNLGVKKEQVRAEVERFIQDYVRSEPHKITADRLLYTRRAQEVIAHARLEAADLKHNQVGTESLLFGLTHDMRCVSAIVLKDVGVTIETVRAEYRKLVAEEAD